MDSKLRDHTDAAQEIAHTAAEAAAVEAKDDPSLPERWRRAPRGSQECRKVIFCKRALRVL